MPQRFGISLVLLLTLSNFNTGAAYSLEATKKPSVGNKKKTSKASRKSSPDTIRTPYDLGVHFGVTSFFLPLVGGELSYHYKNHFTLGLEAGYFALPLDQLNTRSNLIGFVARYFPTRSSFFCGLSYGNRQFSVRTYDKLSVDGMETIIYWQQNITQSLATLLAGWQWIGRTHSVLTFTLGLYSPLITSHKVVADPDRLHGADPGYFSKETAIKRKNAETYTQGIFPLIAVNYGWLMDLW